MICPEVKEELRQEASEPDTQSGLTPGNGVPDGTAVNYIVFGLGAVFVVSVTLLCVWVAGA
jgi:hypothetical protein